MSLLENKFKEQHLLSGEQLLDNNTVLEVLEIERNLWSVMIKDNGVIEVEVQNPNTKAQKSTCECKTYIQEKSCAHIVAALLHLRKLEEDKVSARKKRQNKSQKQAFNIKTILNEIDAEQLKNYVRSYAQKDRNFGVMLKASFAKSIDLNDNLIKYQSILASLIKPITTEKLKSSSADLRLGLKVIDEFNAQLEDSLSMSQYEEAFIILEATLPKLHYLYSKYNIRKEVVANWISKFHNHLDLIYNEKLAPNFKEEIDEFIIELSEKSYYNHLQSALSLFQILSKHKREKSKIKLISKLKEQDISNVKEESKVVFGALLILNNLYDQLKINNDLKLESIKYLIQSGNEEEAVKYLEYFLENEHRNRKMEATLIDVYQNQKNHKKFQELAIYIFVKYTDIRYYRKLKEKCLENEWPKVKKLITKAIEKYQPSSQFLGIYYSNEEMYDELVSVLETELELRHIMKYDYQLYKSNYIDLEHIYHKAVSHYLDSHVGAIAGNFIEEVFAHLSSIKAYKLESSLKKHISTNYPHRKKITSFS